MGWQYARAVWQPGPISKSQGEGWVKAGVVFDASDLGDAETLLAIDRGDRIVHFTVLSTGVVYQHFYPDEKLPCIGEDLWNGMYVWVLLAMPYAAAPNAIQLDATIQLVKWLTWVVFPSAKVLSEMTLQSSESVQGYD